MKSSSQSGFTLVELLVTTFLSCIVMGALIYIMIPLILAQAYAGHAQTVQLNLALMDKLVEQQLRQASLVTAPSCAAGVCAPSDKLEGCDNATASAEPPGCLLGPCPTGPMSWFAFCTTGGVAYYHSGAGCPASGNYVCGTAPTAAFGPLPNLALGFTRLSAGSTLVVSSMTASSGNSTALVTSAVSFSAPAGGAQQ